MLVNNMVFNWRSLNADVTSDTNFSNIPNLMLSTHKVIIFDIYSMVARNTAISRMW